MRVRSLVGAAMLTASLAAPAVAQRDFSGVEFEVTHVSGAVWVLISGAGGNIGVSSGPDGVLMVDDQFAPLADKIRAALREAGQTGMAAEPKFLLNTHWHGDHTGGNVEFGERATIVAHTNVRERLVSSQNEDGNAVPVALPVITFDESLSIHFNGEEIRAFHVPNGHTDGDAIVYFMESNVIHMGDDFFAGRFPYVDIASGGSVEGLERGVGEVLQHVSDDAAIIPGHGPLSTVEDLETYHRMLGQTIAMVRRKMDRGMTSEQIQGEGVSEEWSEWGTGFINTGRWLDTIFQSLSGAADGDYVEHGHDGEEPHAHGSGDRQRG